MPELIEVPKATIMREISKQALDKVRIKALQTILPYVNQEIRKAASIGHANCKFEASEHKHKPLVSQTLVNYLNSQGYTTKLDNNLRMDDETYFVSLTISWSSVK